jgi:DNA polymerase-3 subunit alpha
MSEVKDKAIQKITFDVPLDKLTSTMVEDLAEIVKENPGEADLVFNIHTSDSNKVSLMSRNVKVRVGKRLVQYIKEHDEIGIKVN